MGRKNAPRAGREARVPIAPSMLERPQELVSSPSRGLCKDTPVAGGEGDALTTTSRKEQCSCSHASPGFAVCFHHDTSAGSWSADACGWAQRVMEKSSHTYAWI